MCYNKYHMVGMFHTSECPYSDHNLQQMRSSDWMWYILFWSSLSFKTNSLWSKHCTLAQSTTILIISLYVFIPLIPTKMWFSNDTITIQCFIFWVTLCISFSSTTNGISWWYLIYTSKFDNLWMIVLYHGSFGISFLLWIW